HVTTQGWSIVSHGEICFRRASGFGALPNPIEGASIDDIRAFINIEEADWPLLKAWIMASNLPHGPYTVLHIMGEFGSAKSILARMLRLLIDPAEPLLRSAPREVRDMAIGANACWVLPYDNISTIPEWMSDTLARLSTGNGWTTRQLHTDEDEILFKAQRPLILTS